MVVVLTWLRISIGTTTTCKAAVCTNLGPGSTLHGYLSKILARSCQDLGKILAKIVTRYCQELQDAVVRSYQESHVSKKNLTEKDLKHPKNLVYRFSIHRCKI